MSLELHVPPNFYVDLDFSQEWSSKQLGGSCPSLTMPLSEYVFAKKARCEWIHTCNNIGMNLFGQCHEFTA